MLKIMAFPAQGDSYTDCHYQALRKQGVQVIVGIFSLRWLLRNLWGIDYLHLHWPSFFYRNASQAKSVVRFGKLCLLLALARSYGVSIVWTAHNLYPHDKNSWPLLDRLSRQLITRMAAQIFVHGPAAARLVGSKFPATRGKLAVIWHGHWIDYYPRGCTKREARLKLEVPVDAYVYVFVGACKEYKNLHELIPTFQSMEGTAWLVIAGRFQSEEYQHQIERLVAQKSAKIRFFREYIPDVELQYYLAAADIVVLPYAEILTSGSAMLALSFGRPVIAPRRGFLEDVIVSKVGLLYDPSDPQRLATAMKEAQTLHFDEEEILRHARHYDWESSARTVAATLKQLHM